MLNSSHLLSIDMVRVWILFINIFSTIYCNKPIFSDDVWIQMLFLPHDTPPGSVIYRVQANDNEAVPQYPLTFTISGRGSEFVGVTSISATEADLILTKKLTKGSIYPIALQVTDTANEKNIIEIRINATDANALVNNALVSYPEKPISVPEDTRPGNIIGTIIVKKRPDSDRYPVLILSKSSKFRLELSLTTNEVYGRIILAEALDYEVQNYYTLNVTVYRGPYNKLLDNRNILMIPITIIVEDVQDTNPIFTQLPLLTRMRSDTPVGTVLLQIKAIDGDRSLARSIVYSIHGENSQHFYVNSKTGHLSTVNAGNEILKGCQNSAFIIEVRAEEENDRRSQTIQEIVIFIEATTKPKPKFKPDLVKTNIDENLSMLTTIRFQPPLHLSDEDNCALLQLTIQDEGNLKASQTFGLNPSQVIRSSDIEIFVKNPSILDYEEIKEITFRIIARPDDPLFASYTSSAVVTLILNDVNDNEPQFIRQIYEANIPESAAIGSLIVQVSATDKDSNLNGDIRYTKLTGDYLINEVFNLNPDSGIITLARRGLLDRETVNKYEFNVEACDQQGRGLCNTTKVIVKVTDDNDNKPIFDSNRYYACLIPGMKRGEIFFSLKALDKDEPDTPNSFIVYEITSGNPNDYFYINRQGNLSITTDANNIPKNQDTQLLIRARDNGNPPQSSETTVHISADPMKCTQHVMEYIVSDRPSEIKKKKAQYERILTELNSGSVTRIDKVKLADDGSKGRIITSVVRHANHSVIDLTVWEREFGIPNGPSGSPSSELQNETKIARAESEAWKWILIALLIILAIVFIILLCCCLCKPNSKLKTSQVNNKQRNHSIRDDHHNPPRPRHHHRHRQHQATERITSAPMVNGKTNIPYSRHIAEEVLIDPPSARRQVTTAASNGDTALTQRSANPPRIVQEMQANESSGQSEVIAVISEDTTADIDNNGPHAQLKNQFLEKKSLFTIAYDGMHSKHDLLKDKDYPPSSNTPVS